MLKKKGVIIKIIVMNYNLPYIKKIYLNICLNINNSIYNI